ncbi:MAG: YadA-like family protein [Synergistaceae bacterium]|nr:YadA-like family protein [Synergistaceae bacterium]
MKYDEGTSGTSVTFGDGKTPVKLKNVADGDISAAESKEAVNGGQLYATNRYIDVVSGDLGQKINDISVNTELAVKYDDDTKKAVTLGDGKNPVKLKNVADAELSDTSTEAVTGRQLYAVSGDLNQKINDISVNTELAVKYDDDTKKAVTLGDGKNPVKLKNVADAELSDTSTEAVTGRQLYAVSSDLNQKINDISVNTGFAVKYDDAAKTSVTFGDGATPVRLKNVAAGTSETEAVNYGQLSELDAKVNTLGGTVAERMGGAYDNATGKFTVTYPSGPTPPANSAAAPSGPAANAAIPGADPTLNETLQKMWDSIQTGGVTAGDNISVEGGKVSVVKNPEFESVKVGAVDITREGIDMGGKNITGLADGGIYNGSSDAVNGGQLWNAYNRIEELDNDIRVAGAHAAALSAMHPIAYNPYEPTTISAGYGYYRSEQSFAVGVFHYIRENVLVNAGVAFNSDGDTMGRAGVSFALGKSGRKQPSMIKDVSEMQKQMAAMKEMLMQLKEENERNKEENRKNRETIKELKEALKEKK